MKIAELFTYLNNQQAAQNYLYRCYQGMDDAEVKSFQNSSTFMYYLDHGLKFYENGEKADIVVQPVLYFYGMVHLLKAILLTKRPDYPESTSMLAHGVTARKRKKKNYQFMDDEIKIQQLGLFPYFSRHLYSVDSSTFEKMEMETLFSLLPEMDSIFSMLKKRKMVIVGTKASLHLQFPLMLLDNYHLTSDAFMRRIQAYLPTIVESDHTKEMLHIELKAPLRSPRAPFYTHIDNQDLYFPLIRNHFLPLSEVMIHYLILFNLSMLCRYETEWWGDLLLSRGDMDYAFITHFLQITVKKVPLLIGEELLTRLKGE